MLERETSCGIQIQDNRNLELRILLNKNNEKNWLSNVLSDGEIISVWPQHCI